MLCESATSSAFFVPLEYPSPMEGSSRRNVYLPNLPRGYNQHFHNHLHSSVKRGRDGVISEADGLKDAAALSQGWFFGGHKSHMLFKTEL